MCTEKISLNDFLERPIHCNCGRTHTTDLQNVEIGSKALRKVPAILNKLGSKHPLIVADQYTHAAAGESVASLLEDAGISYSYLILEGEHLIPDEHAVGSMVMHAQDECDMLIGVGAGTINDLSRFVSYRLKLPYIAIATAPSMDGYASSVAPLLTDNLKTTYNAQVPQAIIADLDVISQAPMEMIAAGFADLIGKVTCLADWELSAAINDEYYCSTIAGMMKTALDQTLELLDKLVVRDQEAVMRLMESLVLAGVAMSFAGNSRPASGSEHHFAHFLEMRMLFEGLTPSLHGTNVGIGTVMILKLHEYLREQDLTAEEVAQITPTFDEELWESEIKRVYREASAGVLKLEKSSLKNDFHKHQARIEVIAKKWSEIEKIIKSLPDAEEIAKLLKSVQGATSPKDVDVDKVTLEEIVLYAKELRSRYTILQLLWDLDLLASFAKRLGNDFFSV